MQTFCNVFLICLEFFFGVLSAAYIFHKCEPASQAQNLEVMQNKCKEMEPQRTGLVNRDKKSVCTHALGNTLQYLGWTNKGAGSKRVRQGDTQTVRRKRRRVEEVTFELVNLKPDIPHAWQDEETCSDTEIEDMTGQDEGNEVKHAARNILESVAPSNVDTNILENWMQQIKNPVTMRDEIQMLWSEIRRLQADVSIAMSRTAARPVLRDQSTQTSDIDEDCWWPGLSKDKMLAEGEFQISADESPVMLTRENLHDYIAVPELNGDLLCFNHDFPEDLPESLQEFDCAEATERVEFVMQQIGVVAKDHANWTEGEREMWCPGKVCKKNAAMDRSVLVVELNEKNVFGESEDEKWSWMTCVPVRFSRETKTYTWRLLAQPAKDIPVEAVENADWEDARRISAILLRKQV